MTSPSHPKTNVAVVGASGYAGEELVRLLLAHPHAQLSAVTSRQYAGQTIAQVFPRFAHLPQARHLRFQDPKPELIAHHADVIFLALPHGVSAEYAVPLLQLGARIIDLSADFRVKDPEIYQEFYNHPHPAPDLLEKSVYGLPEAYRDEIKSAILLACPGCYPTSILIPTLPLLQHHLIQPHKIIADSLSGVTGAGRKVELDYLFAECNESIRPYGIPKHRHLSEIEQELSRAAAQKIVIQFTPHLVPVNRGILTTLYFEPAIASHDKTSLENLSSQVASAYQQAYGTAPFIRILEGKALPDTKNTTGTNFLELAWRIDPRTGRLIVITAEDNIVKGTSGQAVQCFNLMCGYPETAGILIQ